MSPSGRQCQRKRYRSAWPGSSGRAGRRGGRRADAGEAVITIAEYGEFALIAAIAERLPPGPGLVLGVGDDAAVLRAPDGRVVATTDMLLEGRHFRREWSSPRDIGAKAAARNLADIAAMGATPTALLVSFAGPGDLKVDWVLELVDGIAEECARAGAGVAGGDTSGADTVMLAVTALGDLAGVAPVTRGGARPGDVVAVAGRLGGAAAGLALLSGGHGSLDDGLGDLISAHRHPAPPYEAGPEAAALGATAMIDVSDGLVADLGHVAAASSVAIRLTWDLIAAGPAAGAGPLDRAAGLLGGADWREWVLAGGDDHALVATFPPETALPERWQIIGDVAESDPGGNGDAGVTLDGRPWGGPRGWQHFRN
jgi:thiamine-monophosphate kinase